MDLTLQNLDTGPGYWKLNVSILENLEVIEAIESLWLNELNPMSLHDSQWWKLCKVKFKEVLIFHSKRLSDEMKTKLHSLESDLAIT